MKNSKFTDEFKAQAIRLVVEEKIPVDKAAKDLGIGKSTLGNWMRQSRLKTNAPTLVSDVEELKRLRKENQTLRMERDILKKATAYFAKHSV